LVEKWTSGPLADKSKNFNDQLHQEYNPQTVKIIENYLTKASKNAEDLTEQDFKSIAEEMKASGGAIKEFLDRLSTDVSPELRDIDEGLKAAVDKIWPGGRRCR
jgi:hypothetical protein